MEHRASIGTRSRPWAAVDWWTPARTMPIVTFLLVFTLGARLRIDTDIWWHIRSGAEILDNGIIREDTFSFTKAGAAWIDHSWGAQVLIDLIWRAAGYGGLEVMTGLLAVAGGWFVYRMCWGDVYVRSLAVAIASMTAAVFWAPRPHMFSYALTALVLYVLFLRRHRNTDVLWALPAVMLVWANLHGAYAIGLLLIACTIAGEALENILALDDRGHLGWACVRKLALVGAASLVAVCVNPYGPRILAVPFETAGGSYARAIDEWQPPNLHHAGFWPFFVMLVLLVLCVGVSPRRIGWTDWLLSAAAIALALTAGRNVATFAVVVAPVITYHLAATLQAKGWTVKHLDRATPAIAALNVTLIAVVAVFCVGRVSDPFRDRPLAAAERSELPVAAVDYLRRQGVDGAMFNQYEWGGYLMHALPQVPVFVDGRSDLYGGEFLYDTYLVTARGEPGWRRTLDEYRVGTVLVPADSGLASVLRRAPAWRVAHQDPLAAIFSRRAGSR